MLIPLSIPVLRRMTHMTTEVSSIKKWTNTNIQAMVDNGKLQGPRSEWFNGNGSYNNDLFPNAIDPDLFYDKDGKLWMTYGSWSGGIFELQIDKESGKPVYRG